MDLQANSIYDAAHIYVCLVKEHPERGLPRPTLATSFEVVIGGKVYRVEGRAPQRWIVQRRQESNGPRGICCRNLAPCCCGVVRRRGSLAG
jgi:hypothetical protein